MLSGAVSGCQLLGYEALAERGWRDPLDASGGRVMQDAQLSDAGADAATEVDGCVEQNACGGCGSLGAELASACGQCGLGSYVCEGTESLVCLGADASPSAGSATTIADWDHGDALTSDGHGYSYSFSDGTPGGTLNPPDGSLLLPSAGGAAATLGCAHLSGQGFAFFAGMITSFNTAQCSFDASSKRGIAFWLRGSASDDVYVSVATTATKDSASCGSGCNDLHNMRLTLTSDWQHYAVQWSDLQQSGWGTPAALDASQLRYIQFSFGPNTTFDLWVDELNFF